MIRFKVKALILQCMYVNINILLSDNTETVHFRYIVNLGKMGFSPICFGPYEFYL